MARKKNRSIEEIEKSQEIRRKKNRERKVDDKILNFKELVSRKKRVIKNAGIYVLFRHGKIIYIGQTINGLRRIYDHLDKGFTEYTFISCRRRDLNRIEAEYIKRYSPCLNIVHNTEFVSEQKAKKMIKEKDFKEIPNKCMDCKTEFDIRDKICPSCGGRNIRLGGRFKVNKAKKQLTEELVNE